MGEKYTLHKSVIGHNHLRKDPVIPCEDCSGSYSGDGYYIAIVADGHGDSACLRSSIGSELVVEVTLDCLKTYAEVLQREKSEDTDLVKELLSIPKYRKIEIKRLTDTIMSRWHSKTQQHLFENPLTEEDYDKSGVYKEIYQNGEHLEHIYGTTLIAALWISDMLLLLQQGDGRCEVVFSDGQCEQPIPWDDRCYENVTTSMCDEDAPESIRHCVLNLKERNVIACFVGTDGIEDSYSDMEGTHTFYCEQMCKIVEKYEAYNKEMNDCENESFIDDYEQYLETFFPEFTKAGSGDDISIAGIVDVEAIKAHLEDFSVKVEKYKLRDSLKMWEQKKNSMIRKHGILSKYFGEAQKELDSYQQKVVLETEKLKQLEEQYEKLLEEQNAKETNYNSFMEAFDELQEYESSICTWGKVLDRLLGDAYDQLMTSILNKKDNHQQTCADMNTRVIIAKEKIEKQKRIVERFTKVFKEQEEQYLAIREEYFNYNELYLQVERKYKEILDEIE